MTTVRRRDLAALLTASGGLLLGSACSRRTTPIPTSPDVDRDPLAELDRQLWPARSGAEMLEVPLEGDAPDSEAWSQLDADEDLHGARRQLVDFLTVAYLDPESLGALDNDAARARVAEVALPFWQEELDRSWDGGDRYFYAIAFAEGFRSVGRPAIAVQWLRGENEDGEPTLLVGGTLAWTVLDTTTRAVGVIAYRYGIAADLAADGSIDDARFRITIHGLDGCESFDGGGLLVPALADTESHRSAQEHTLQTVIASPQVGREDLEDPDSALLSGDETTNAMCR